MMTPPQYEDLWTISLWANKNLSFGPEKDRDLDLSSGRVEPTWEDHEFSLRFHGDGGLSCLDSEAVERWSVFSISYGEAEPTRLWAWDQTQAHHIHYIMLYS